LIFVLNSPGTIDPEFKDEIKVILYNAGDKPFICRPGDRIAQGVVVKREPRCLGVEEEATTREGGLGSTGVMT
jgi:dUTP pyrophosphatase